MRPARDKVQITDIPFKKLRLSVGLSQENLARRIGVAVSTIRHWEKGQAEPTMTVAQMRRFLVATKQSFNNLPESLTELRSLSTKFEGAKFEEKHYFIPHTHAPDRTSCF